MSIPGCPFDHLEGAIIETECEEDVIALMTAGLVLLPLAAVSVVLAWAESRARRFQTSAREPPHLTRALLAAREDGVSHERGAMGGRERTLECS